MQLPQLSGAMAVLITANRTQESRKVSFEISLVVTMVFALFCLSQCVCFVHSGVHVLMDFHTGISCC